MQSPRLPAFPPCPTCRPSTSSVAPAGTPKPIVDRLHREFNAIVARPEFAEQVGKMGLLRIDSAPPDELQRYLLAEIDRWGKLVHEVGIAGTE